MMNSSSNQESPLTKSQNVGVQPYSPNNIFNDFSTEYSSCYIQDQDQDFLSNKVEKIIENQNKLMSSMMQESFNSMDQLSLQLTSNNNYLQKSFPNSSIQSKRKKQNFSQKKLTLNLEQSIRIRNFKDPSQKLFFEKNYDESSDLELSSKSYIDSTKLMEEKYYSKYEEIEDIDRGFQGTVKKIREIKSNKIFAAKIYNNNLEDDELLQSIKNEFNILQQLNHKNIVKVYELIESQFEIIIIMEFVEGTPLINLKYKSLKEEEQLKIIKKILKTVQYLHQNDIIHRDITNKNILYNEATNKIKLIDFGIAKQILQKEISFTPVGNPSCLAPEIIQGVGYNQKIDIFQIGMIFFEIYEKVEIMKSVHLIKKIKQNSLKFKHLQNEQIQNIIIQMLNLNQEQRISIEESLEQIKQIKF